MRPQFITLLRSISLFFALLFLSLPAFTQKVWTLEDCINYAMDNNLDIKKQVDMVQSNKATLLQTGLSALPSINAGASNVWNFGNTVDRYTNTFATTTVLSDNFSLSADFTIFNGLQKLNTYKQNKVDLLASQYDLDVIKDNISLSVAGYYLDILFNYELLSVARAQVATTKEQVDRMQKMVEAGSTAKGDLLNIQAQAAAEDLTVVEAENRLLISLLTLQQLIDLPVSKDFAVEQPNLKLIEPPTGMITPDYIYEQALATKPEIKGSELKVESALKGISIARSGISPNLSFGGTWATGYSGASYDTTGLIFPFHDQLKNNENKSIGFFLNVPIFNGWQVHTAISRAKIQHDIAELNLESQKRDLRKKIEQAWADAAAALKKYNSSKEKVTAQEESFNYTTQKFDVGMLTSFDYNNNKKELTLSQSQLLQAKYDYIFKTTILDFYMGNPIRIVRE